MGSFLHMISFALALRKALPWSSGLCLCQELDWTCSTARAQIPPSAPLPYLPFPPALAHGDGKRMKMWCCEEGEFRTAAVVIRLALRCFELGKFGKFGLVTGCATGRPQVVVKGRFAEDWLPHPKSV